MDVVAELDRWLAANWDETGYYDVKPGMLQRARDEIMALRETVERQRFVLSKGHAEVRAEALEIAPKIWDAGEDNYRAATQADVDLLWQRVQQLAREREELRQAVERARLLIEEAYGEDSHAQER